MTFGGGTGLTTGGSSTIGGRFSGGRFWMPVSLEVDMVFDSSPVFRLQPDARQKNTSAVAWFSGTETLSSGWAWGQQYLDGGTAVAEASLGEGKVILMGPEVAFRAQPHATFKLLFNGVYYGSAKATALP